MIWKSYATRLCFKIGCTSGSPSRLLQDKVYFVVCSYYAKEGSLALLWDIDAWAARYFRVHLAVRMKRWFSKAICLRQQRIIDGKAALHFIEVLNLDLEVRQPLAFVKWHLLLFSSLTPLILFYFVKNCTLAATRNSVPKSFIVPKFTASRRPKGTEEHLIEIP